MFLGDPPGTQRGAEQDVEQEGGILLGLEREMVPSLHYHKLTAQLTDIWREKLEKLDETNLKMYTYNVAMYGRMLKL